MMFSCHRGGAFNVSSSSQSVSLKLKWLFCKCSFSTVGVFLRCRCKKHPASSLGSSSALVLFNMVEKERGKSRLLVLTLTQQPLLALGFVHKSKMASL